METIPEETRRDLVPEGFRPGPTIPGHQVQYDAVQHAWIIDHVLLRGSVADYRCLELLLESANRCVPFARLLSCFPEASGMDTKQERMRLAHVISRLRSRLWPLGLDIGCVMSLGYMLLSGSQEHASLSRRSPDSDESL